MSVFAIFPVGHTTLAQSTDRRTIWDHSLDTDSSVFPTPGFVMHAFWDCGRSLKLEHSNIRAI